jgi:hypothetical protein
MWEMFNVLMWEMLNVLMWEMFNALMWEIYNVGEKGVPFRVQVETYSYGDEESKLLHCASCQVKVFKVSRNHRYSKTLLS